MEEIKKRGLLLKRNGDKVFLDNFMHFTGADEADFLPGTGGIYTLQLGENCYDGMGLISEGIYETENGMRAVFSNDIISLDIDFSYDKKSDVWSRKDKITNKTDKSEMLHKYQSRFVVSEAVGAPEFYTQNSGWCSENQGTWQNAGRGLRVETRSLRVMDGATPYMAMRKKDSNKGVAFHIAPIGKWSINVTKRIAYSRKAAYVIDMGLAETGLHMEIKPHETLEMPEIIFHNFSDVGLGGYKLQQFVIENRFNANPPKVIYNSWLYNFDNFTEYDLERQLNAVSEIGVDYFLVDAGWYGDTVWSESTGDWQESKVKFPDGLCKFAEKVRSKGVGLGLWMECERASKASEIYKKHPEYFFETEDDNTSVIIDFSVPEARNHVFNEISRLIDTYDLKMMKFDFNVGATHDKTGSNFYRYYKNFYEMMDELKKKYPYFFFEGCAGGGCCSDISSMAHYDCHHMTDTVHPVMDLRIYQGAMLRLPPFSLSKWVCIQSADLKSVNVTYQTKDRVVSNSNQFLYEYVVDCGLDFIVKQASMGLLGFSSDVAALSEDTRKKLKQYVDDFKTDIEQKSKSVCALLVPPAPIGDSFAPAVFQFADYDFNKSHITAFRVEGVENSFNVDPVGIEKGSMYEVVDGNSTYTVSGEEIAEYGMTIKIDDFYSVKTITLKKL